MIRNMECVNCGSSKIENRDLMLCSSCAHALRKAERMQAPKDQAPIAKVSESMGKQLNQYAAKKAKWVKGKKCAAKFPHDCNGGLTVQHMCGRVGYADEWARENEMPLLLDVRFWMPLCLNAHVYVNDHPKWASENSYTFLRVTDPVFRTTK